VRWSDWFPGEPGSQSIDSGSLAVRRYQWRFPSGKEPTLSQENVFGEIPQSSSGSWTLSYADDYSVTRHAAWGEWWRTIFHIGPWTYYDRPVDYDTLPAPPGARIELRGFSWTRVTVDLRYSVERVSSTPHGEAPAEPIAARTSSDWFYPGGATIEDVPSAFDLANARLAGSALVPDEPIPPDYVTWGTMYDVELETINGEPRGVVSLHPRSLEPGGSPPEGFVDVEIRSASNMSIHHSAYEWRYSLDPIGAWRTRQRQTLTGSDSWPLRQRQNGGATGSWPIRQRQSGM